MIWIDVNESCAGHSNYTTYYLILKFVSTYDPIEKERNLRISNVHSLLSPRWSFNKPDAYKSLAEMLGQIPATVKEWGGSGPRVCLYFVFRPKHFRRGRSRPKVPAASKCAPLGKPHAKKPPNKHAYLWIRSLSILAADWKKFAPTVMSLIGRWFICLKKCLCSVVAFLSVIQNIWIIITVTWLVWSGFYSVVSPISYHSKTAIVLILS